MASQNPVHRHGRSGTDVRHSRDRALDEREFELLIEGARRLADSPYYHDPDPVFTILALGRLGLRRGELAHLQESWVDWREKMIQIPASEPCTCGDSGACGMCRQLAQQRADHADDLSFQQALDYMWVPKTQAAARDVYYGFSTRVEMYLERYFDSDEYTRYEPSATAISRRVKHAADLARELEPSEVMPHGLRATAATYHGGRGLRLLQLMQLFGWCQPQTAERYISRNGMNTARQLNTIHSR